MKISTQLGIGLLLACCASGASAQDLSEKPITLLVLNGRDGKPMLNETILVFVGTSANHHARDLHGSTDKNGVAVLPFLSRENDLVLSVFPDVLSGCYEHPNLITFNVAEIRLKGITTKNTCGSIKAPSVPGRLTLFARPMTLLEKMDW